jgi:hypothetical protein
MAGRQERVRIDDGTLCPVSDVLLSRIYRADADELRPIVLALSETVRASLAVFCYQRAHLRDISRQITALCDPVTLVRNGGGMGLAILAAAEEAAPVRQSHRPKVTLASAELMRARLPLDASLED